MTDVTEEATRRAVLQRAVVTARQCAHESASVGHWTTSASWAYNAEYWAARAEERR